MSMFSHRFLYALSLILQEKIAFPEEEIFLDGEVLENDKNIHLYTDRSLYIIQQGEVEIYFNKTNFVFKTLGVDSYFGEISFYSDQPRTASARSVDFANLFIIKRQDFIKLINNFPRDKEKFF